MQHRFYGQSIPHGFTREEALENATIRGYFNSAQAIADYAELIINLKKNLSADSSPVIMVRGSYSGSKTLMKIRNVNLTQTKLHILISHPNVFHFFIFLTVLAAWFRVKYPHIAMEAVASSAPVLYFEDLVPHDSYYVVVTKDFQVKMNNLYSIYFEPYLIF